MTLSINNNSTPSVITGKISESTRSPSSEDFISKAIYIVKTSAQEETFHEQLQALRGQHSAEEIALSTPVLIEKIKESSASDQNLPMIYRHLIRDLDLRILGDISIYNEEFRIAKARLAAEESPHTLCENIQKYNIQNQDALVEIIKLAAQKDVGSVCVNIGKFGIKSEEVRIAIAKIAAEEYPIAVSMHINAFGIRSGEALVEIAKIVAQVNGNAISLYIKDYGITNEEALVEIAKLAAHQNCKGVSENIKNFGIKSEKSLIEIAKIAAQQKGKTVSKCIKNYGIQSEEALIEIAQIAYRQNPSLNIINFLNILNSNNRVCLISIFIKLNPEIVNDINTYIPELIRESILEQYPELRALGLKCNPQLEFLSQFEIDKVPDTFSERRKALYQDMIQEKDPELKTAKMNIFRVFCSVLDFAEGSPSLLEKFSTLITSVQQERNLHIQKQKTSVIATLLLHCRTQNVDKEALSQQFFLLNQMFTLQDPSLLSYLIYAFVDNVTNPALHALVKEHASEGLVKKNKYSTADLTLAMLAPFITNMPSYAELIFTANKTHISERDPEIRYVPFITRMKELLNHKFFQGDRLKAQSLLRSLRILAEDPRLTPIQKTSVLRDLVFVGHPITVKDNFKKDQCERLLRSAETVALMIQCNQLEQLVSINSEQLHEQFPQMFTSLLEMDVPNHIILNTIAKWRKPSALLTYAGNVKSHLNIGGKVLPFLKQFATSVVNGTFTTDRYDTSSAASEHWLKVQEKAPALIEKWKAGSRYSEDGFEVVDTDDPCDLMLSGTEVGSCQKVDGSLSYSKCLIAYLMDPKIRMMAIKNKNGVIVARCMLRLLWDTKAEKFVLFQEKPYPEEADPSFEAMLNRSCKKRAEELGLGLLIKDTKAKEVTTLKAFKGKVPFEYVDASDGVRAHEHIQTDAGYEINHSKYIYQPVSSIEA